MGITCLIMNTKSYSLVLERGASIELHVEGSIADATPRTPIFITLHDIGSSYKNLVKLSHQKSLQDAIVQGKAVFVHVCLPGQQPAAEDLTSFPKLELLGLELLSILDLLGIGQDQPVVLLGEGAGGYLAARLAMHLKDFLIQHRGRNLSCR